MLILFYFCFVLSEETLTAETIEDLLSPEPEYEAKLHPEFASLFAVSCVDGQLEELKNKIEIFSIQFKEKDFEDVKKLHYQVVDGMGITGGGIKAISGSLVALSRKFKLSLTGSFDKYCKLVGFKKKLVESAFYWYGAQQKDAKVSYEAYVAAEQELSHNPATAFSSMPVLDACPRCLSSMPVLDAS